MALAMRKVISLALLLALVLLPKVLPAQLEDFKEAIRQQEGGASGRQRRATGESKAHRKVRRMMEKIRGTGATAYKPRPAGEVVEEEMKRLQKETLYVYLAIGVPVAVAIVWFLLRFLFNLFVQPMVRPIRALIRSKPLTRPTKKQVRQLVSMAKRYERRGAFLDAAQLWEGADQMAVMIARASGKTPQRPEDRPHFVRAAELYEKGRNFKKASELYGKMHRPGKTKQLFLLQAKEYESQSKFLLAADMYAKAGDFISAAAMNEAGGHLHAAATYYEKAGESASAARLLEKFYRQERLDYLGPVRDSEAEAYVRKYGIKTAKLYAKAGKFAKSAKIFAEFGENVAAAKMFLKAHQPENAVKALVKTDDTDLLGQALSAADISAIEPETLAEALEKMGNIEAAAEQLLQAGRGSQAATLYERAGRFDKAASICEERGETALAAELWAKAGDFERSAELYLKANDLRAAAEAYRRAKRLDKVAELQGQMGDFLGAATELFRLGQEEKAIALLQRIDKGHPDFVQANLELARRFVDRKRPAMAKGALQRVVSAAPSRSREAAEAFYMLAVLYNGEGMVEKAREYLEKVLDIDYSFRDASRLYDSLLGRSGSPPADER